MLPGKRWNSDFPKSDDKMSPTGQLNLTVFTNYLKKRFVQYSGITDRTDGPKNTDFI